MTVKPATQLSKLSALVAMVALGLAGALTGCTLSVEADVPDVQITQSGLTFEGVAAAMGDASMTKSYSQQHSQLDLPSQLDTQVRTLAVTLTATSGVTDLSFIKFMSVSMSADADSAPTVIGSYEPATGAAVGNQLKLTTLNPVNILDAWKTDTATFTLQLAGTLPTSDWTGDISIDLSGSAKFTY
jgi:hypothetical protein